MDDQTDCSRLLSAALLPLAHLLIAQKISHSEFAEAAKEAYVAAAETFFSLPKRKMTDSRVSVLTGMSRKEVYRLRNKDNAVRSVKYQKNRAARVITGWMNDARFMESDGTPSLLPLRGEHSFATLVAKYSGDITTGAILEELRSMGIVSVDEQGNVRLDKFGYIPDVDKGGKLGVLLQCAKDMLETGAHNITRENDLPLRFQRQLSFSDVTPDIADAFEQLCHEQSMQLLLQLNSWLTSAMENSPPLKTTSGLRVGLGIYQIKESENEREL